MFSTCLVEMQSSADWYVWLPVDTCVSQGSKKNGAALDNAHASSDATEHNC
jgi:hypothetical protein